MPSSLTEQEEESLGRRRSSRLVNKPITDYRIPHDNARRRSKGQGTSINNARARASRNRIKKTPPALLISQQSRSGVQIRDSVGQSKRATFVHYVQSPSNTLKANIDNYRPSERFRRDRGAEAHYLGIIQRSRGTRAVRSIERRCEEKVTFLWGEPREDGRPNVKVRVWVKEQDRTSYSDPEADGEESCSNAMDQDREDSNSIDSNIAEGMYPDPDPADSSQDVSIIGISQTSKANQGRTIETEEVIQARIIETVEYVTIDDEELVEPDEEDSPPLDHSCIVEVNRDFEKVNSIRVVQVHQSPLERVMHSRQEVANTPEDSVDLLLDDSLDTIFYPSDQAEIEVIDLTEDEVIDIPDVVTAQPPITPTFPSMDDTGAICPVCLDSLDNIKKSRNKFLTLSCGHLFCDSCLVSSLSVRPHCPVCRTLVKNTGQLKWTYL